MAKTILQIPIDSSVRDQAVKVVRKLGFSSLQESIRVFLHQLISGTYSVKFEGKPIPLSPKAAVRYDKMAADLESGKEPLYEANNSKDFLDQLYGRKNPIHAKLP